MEVKPYRQSLTHSCLVTCFLMLLQGKNGLSFGEKEEQKLALQGSKRKYPFYVVGIPYEVVNEYKVSITVIADNRYFSRLLKDAFEKKKQLTVAHKPITLLLIEQLLRKQPLICHIDNNMLGDYSHSSHFIVLEKTVSNFIQIIDPWTGKRRRVKKETLEAGVLSLKKHVKMSPLLFSLESV